jgi:hypothetical protein
MREKKEKRFHEREKRKKSVSHKSSLEKEKEIVSSFP